MRNLELTDLTPALAPLALPLLGRALPGVDAGAWVAHVAARAAARRRDPEVPPILALRDPRGVLLAIADLRIEKNLSGFNALTIILYVGHDLLKVTREEAGSLLSDHFSRLAEEFGCTSLQIGIELTQGGRLPDCLAHLLAAPTASCGPARGVLVPLPLSDSVTQLPGPRRRPSANG